MNSPLSRSSPTKVLVVDVVGLTPRLLEVMPRTRAVADGGFRAELGTVLPAVTCTVQSTFLTGLTPAEHGIVGNGWYFRDLGEVHLWRQHNRLVGGEKVWETARGRHPGYRVANVCWWYAMGASTETLITPRPVYHADGSKSPDCYVRPAALHDELTAKLGPFPLFTYWGPTAGIASSRWIIGAARHVLPTHDLTLVYVPHLDYDLQRFGPDDDRAFAAARVLDAELAPLFDDAASAGVTVVVLSEYGITAVDTPVDVNRMLRSEGLLEVHENASGELLDPWASRAFAVADHQLAHIYISDEADIDAVRLLLEQLPGVAEVLDRTAQSAAGIDHERSGELVVVAEPNAWFTYYYWLDDSNAPDFARGVEIHKKPGYDPAELFFDPADRFVKVKAARTLAKKKLGLRYHMDVVPLDPSCVRGSHGRLPTSAADAPVLLCSDPTQAREKISATDVRDLMLGLAGLAG
jgi:predicted AlkP superfamily pyrophosphatase or phosphodiesterase